MRQALENVNELVNGTCCMDINTAKTLQKIIPFGNDVKRILELGVHKGVSSAYFSALIFEGSANSNLQNSYLEGMDIRDVSDANRLLSTLNLGIPFNFKKLPYSYSFEIHKSLFDSEGQIFGKKFDLIYLDGSHQFEIDLTALFMGLNFLRKGGYLVLDDLKWNFSKSSIKRTKYVKKMSEYEKNKPQMSLIWDLIEKDFFPLTNIFTISDGAIGIAQKI